MAERAGIFISYRRVDAGYPAAWLYDTLVGHFGKGRVFMDMDKIHPADDFPGVIRAALDSCGVLLALIGPRWLNVTTRDGRRRLDQPDDFVRQEIETALRRDVPVLPVLVDGAAMPGEAELPAVLSRLAYRHAVDLSQNRIGSDAQHLLHALHALLAAEVAPAAGLEEAGDDGNVAGSVFDVTDPKRLRMELARWRFLRKLHPGLLTAPASGRRYDRHSVDHFLAGLRDVVLEDMTRLQEYVAMASRPFPMMKDGGYGESGVHLFIRELNGAILEYITEVSMPQPGGLIVLSQAEARRQAEIARARFLGKVQPRLIRARGRRRGYDPEAVDGYLREVRQLAFYDVTRLLAFIATTPAVFPAIPRNGYDNGSIELFISDLGHAVQEYFEELLAMYESPSPV